MSLYLKHKKEYKQVSDLVKLLTKDESLSLDIVEKSRLIKNQWYSLELDEKQKNFVGIEGIESQTDHLPKGASRSNWSEDALKKADSESEELEELFRASFDKHCSGILLYLSSLQDN